MKFFHHIAINVAASFAALLAFALVACDDSSSASNDEESSSSTTGSSPSGQELSAKLKEEDAAYIVNFAECNAENEGLIESVCYFSGKYDCAEYNRYRCEQGSWNYMDDTYCSMTNPKEGDECCRNSDSKSYLYVFTSSYGWVQKSSHNGFECKDPIQEYDVCSKPKEACTFRNYGKIDSTTAINSSNTCYIECRDDNWVMLSETAEEVAIRAYSDETCVGGSGVLCCYPDSPGSDSGTYYVSSDLNVFKKDYYNLRHGAYISIGKWSNYGKSCTVNK